MVHTMISSLFGSVASKIEVIVLNTSTSPNNERGGGEANKIQIKSRNSFTRLYLRNADLNNLNKILVIQRIDFIP